MRIVATRTRGGNRDREGALTAPTGQMTFTAVFAPGGSTEDHQFRESTETEATLYTHEIGLDIIDLDHITTPAPVADTWTVNGTPQQWCSPYTGKLRGMVIRLKAFRG